MKFSEIPPPRIFVNQLEDITKKYPNCKGDIQSVLDGLSSNPIVGDVIPGFPPNQIRKLRMPLKKYNIGKRKGLRLIFLVDIVNHKYAKLHIYCKMQYSGEAGVVRNVRDALKELLGEQLLPL